MPKLGVACDDRRELAAHAEICGDTAAHVAERQPAKGEARGIESMPRPQQFRRLVFDA